MRRRIVLLILAAMLALSLVVGSMGGAFAARPAQDKEDCKAAERQGQDYLPPYNNYDNRYDSNGDCIQSVR